MWWRAPSKTPDAYLNYVCLHTAQNFWHPSLIVKSRNNIIELVTGPVDRYVVALLAPASSVYRLQLRRPLVLARGTVTEKDDLKNKDKHQNGIAVGLATIVGSLIFCFYLARLFVFSRLSRTFWQMAKQIRKERNQIGTFGMKEQKMCYLVFSWLDLRPDTWQNVQVIGVWA